MNRLGFAPAAYRAAWLRLSGLTQVDSITLMTHYSDADGARGVHEATAAFEEATRDLPGERSMANSAATLRFAGKSASVRGDWVRPGIMVYGSAPDYPAHDIAHWDLQPTMTLQAEIIAIQDLQAGATVGYGSTFTADRPMRIGVVACGYADGYPRLAPTGTPVLVDGVRARMTGRVSMDMATVDLSPAPGEDVPWRDVANRAVRANVVVMIDVALHRRRAVLKELFLPAVEHVGWSLCLSHSSEIGTCSSCRLRMATFPSGL